MWYGGLVNGRSGIYLKISRSKIALSLPFSELLRYRMLAERA
jgi:hypothetical protein